MMFPKAQKELAQLYAEGLFHSRCNYYHFDPIRFRSIAALDDADQLHLQVWSALACASCGRLYLSSRLSSSGSFTPSRLQGVGSLQLAARPVSSCGLHTPN